jgi:hypothetical protein
MSLIIDFVGIIYFDADREPGHRLVVILNGSDPGDGIEPHVATINIETDQIVTPPTSWPNMVERRTVDRNRGRKRREQLLSRTSSTSDPVSGSASAFSSASGSASATLVADYVDYLSFPIHARSTITITGLTGKGVDTTEHDGFLPRLKDLIPPVKVDLGNADAIAMLGISNGKLLARRLPADEGDGAVVSQLQVEGDLGPITIAVDDGKEIRTITVKDGTEIVIANVSADSSGGDGETAHYQIYRRLSPANTTPIQAPPHVRNDVPLLASDHPFIVDPYDHPEEKCSNTCCG